LSLSPQEPIELDAFDWLKVHEYVLYSTSRVLLVGGVLSKDARIYY
jgi:hypothetical protein